MTINKVNQKKHLISKKIKRRFRYKFMKRTKIIKNNKIQKTETENLAAKSTQIKNHHKEENETKTSKNRDKNKSIFFENLQNEYMYIFLKNHFDTYINDNFYKKLEHLEINRKIITPEVLNKFGLTEEKRNYLLNYFHIFILKHKISPKFYFSSVTLFDSFLINYSKANNTNQCLNLFISKKTNQNSETRMFLLLFCCYYLTAKFYGTDLLTVNKLLEFPQAKEEFSFNDINKLIYDIYIYIDTDLDLLNIYSFIDIYMFEIRRILKQSGLSYYKDIMLFLEKSVFFLGAKLGRNISLLNIEESIQGLGITKFCYELSKCIYQININTDMILQRFFANLTVILTEFYKADKIPIIIDWLNDNYNKENI